MARRLPSAGPSLVALWMDCYDAKSWVSDCGAVGDRTHCSRGGVAVFIHGPEIAKARHYGVVDQKLIEAQRRFADAVAAVKPRSEGTIEDAGARQALPEFKTIAALPVELMTPHAGDAVEGVWPRSAGDNASSKFSGADLVTKVNVKNLEVAWTYDTPGVTANIQATPIYTGNAVVFPDARDHIVALDPATGVELWEFDPQIPRPAVRGLTYRRPAEGHSGVVYFTARGRLFAVDADSGKPDVRFAGGSVAVGSVVKVAPAIWNGLIVVSSTAPALHAFEVATGRHAWTIALRPEDDADPSTRYEGGVNWGGFSIDSGRGLAFVTTSNPSPVGFGGERPGRNPGTSAIVAVDMTSRRIAWEFQEIGHDLWDLYIAAAPVLGSIVRKGTRFDTVVAATKAGNIIVLDRRTGRPVFDYRLRRAPVSTVPGETTQPYQPDPELPEPVGRFAFEDSDVTDIGERNRQSVLEQLRDAQFGFYPPHVPGKQTVFFGLHGGVTQFGPALDPDSQTLVVAANREPSRFSIVDSTALGQPLSGHGAALAAYRKHCASCHGTQLEGGLGPSLQEISAAFSKDDVRHIVHGGVRAMPAVAGITDAELTTLVDGLFAMPKPDVRAGAGASRPREFVRTAYTKLKDNEGYPGSKPPWGTLQAIDLNSGRTRWKVPVGHFEALLARGLPTTGTPNFGGPMITATGLVFVSGTKDKLIRAFDTGTGEELWAHALPHIGSASPMTYVHAGQQYILIPATGGGTLAIYDRSVTTGGSFVAFALKQ